MLDRAQADLLDQYEQWLSSWASAKTVKARVNFNRARLREWGLDGFTAAAIVEFMARPNDNGQPRSRWTKSTYFAHLKSFSEYLVATDLLEESPMEQLRRPKKPKNLPRPLTEAQVGQVLGTAGGRTRDWLLLALYVGLRAHEIAKIRGEDVSSEGIYVLGKGGVEAVLPCHPEINKMAQRYPSNGWWFPSPNGEHITADVVTVGVGRLFASLGIKGSIHRMRHVYGTRLLRTGTNIRKVQHLMRHGTLETTALYTAVDEEELMDAILLLPPPGGPDAAA